jgi:hypothetical protein
MGAGWLYPFQRKPAALPASDFPSVEIFAAVNRLAEWVDDDEPAGR